MEPGDPTARAAGETPSRWRVWLALAVVVPVLFFGGRILGGQLFLPVLPVSLEPLRSENPEAAREADHDARWVLGDRLLPFLTDQVAMREEVLAGRLPSWEPLLGLGVPLFAGSLAAAAYPPNWLAFALPPERAAGPLAMLSLILAGVGTALFLARLGLSRGAVAVGVLAVELGGWGVSNLFYFMKVDAALWIPWSLWAVEGLVTGRRHAGTALAVCVGLSFLAGFVPIAVFGLALCVAYGLARLAPRLVARAEPGPPGPPPGELPRGAQARRRLLWLALFLGLGLALSGVQNVPTWEASRTSARVDGGDLAAQSLPACVLWGTLAPDLFGDLESPVPADGSPVAWWLVDEDEALKAEAANPLEWNAYALSAVVLLALVALVATPRRALFPALALLVVFSFALGRAPGRWLYALPGFDLGAPGRALGLAWILWPWLAALGAEAVIARRPRAAVTLCLASFALAAGSFVLWIGIEPERWARELEQVLLARYGARFDQTLETIRERIPPARALAAAEGLRRSLSYTLGAAVATFLAAVLALFHGRRGTWLGLAPGLAAVVSLATAPSFALGETYFGTFVAALGGVAAVSLLLRRQRPLAWAPLAACVLAEGLLAQNGDPGGIEPATTRLFPASPAIEAVREAAGDGRVLRYDPSPSGVADVERLARPNLLVPYGVHDLTPYLVFTPRTFFELAAATDPDMLFRRQVARLPDPALLDHPVLDLFRVQAVLSLEPLRHPRLEPVLERPGFCVYRRTGALPPARIVPRAVAAASDEQALALLAGGARDLAAETLIAPEDAALLAAEGPSPTPDGSWRPGDIERVEHPARNALAIDVWGSSGGWLVLHEQYLPGWHARVNGEEVPVLRADHAFRAVRIPRGDSRVETWYAPSSLWVGTLCTALALVLAVVLGRRAPAAPRRASRPAL